MDALNENIWPKAMEIAKKCMKTGEPIRTIAQGSKNWVLEVTGEKIVVQSEKDERGQPIGTPRAILKDTVQEAWEILVKNGRMDRKSMKEQINTYSKIWRTGAVIRGLLAILPNVNVEKINRSATLIYKRKK